MDHCAEVNDHPAGGIVRHALTIDLEDYFMVSAFESSVKKSDWDNHESRVVRNTEKVLSLLDEVGAKATFFTVGWVAEKYPELVRKVHSQGHEIACHGYFHSLIYEQTPYEFQADVRRAKHMLERAIHAPVFGYRAPSFSIINDTQWALDILKEEGFTYDASVLPASHARGGLEGSPRYPYHVKGLMEFPMSTVQMGKKNFPFSGGGYFRLLPYPFIRYGINASVRVGQPSIVYLHPWEFDPRQPRLPGKPVDKFKHYLNLAKTEAKFRRLLKDFRFTTAHNVLTNSLTPSGHPR